jgi:NTP pyrophosphatase (non-canonical NTP hydrolase)
MNPTAYQTAIERTMKGTPIVVGNQKQMELLNWTLGLAGETGEFVDLVKKTTFHGHAFSRHDLIEELGDVLWYAAAISTNLGISLDEVMAINVAKLMKRYPEGFDQERSIRRES